MTPFKLRSERLGRVVFALVSLSLILLGVRVLLKDGLFYSNYWGGPVFAPLAIAIGIFCCYLVVFRWRKLAERPARLNGQAARRAQRQAERRAPIDDFDKPWTVSGRGDR
jgi:hypothetical protein